MDVDHSFRIISAVYLPLATVTYFAAQSLFLGLYLSVHSCNRMTC